MPKRFEQAPLLNSLFKTNLRSLGALLHCDFYLLFKKSWIPIYVVNPDWKYPCWSAESSRLKVWKMNWITSSLILQSSGHQKCLSFLERRGSAFHCAEVQSACCLNIFKMTEVQSAYCLNIFKMASSFLTKFWDSGQRFSRNNFIPISLKWETFTHAQLAISFNVYYLLDMLSVRHLHRGYSLINWFKR